MTFKEFKKEKVYYHAYDLWLSVKNAKIQEKIPEKYWKFFDNICECGSENIITPQLTICKCCNPKCTIKMGYALSELFTRFGIKGIGDATSASIYKSLTNFNQNLKKEGKIGLFETDSYIEVLLIPYSDYPMYIANTARGQDFAVACEKVKERVLTFPEMVSMLGLEGLGSEAIKLFHGIDSFDDLINAIKKDGGILSYCYKKGYSAPITAHNVASAVCDIFVASRVFNGAIRKVGLQSISVCLTGSISIQGVSCTKKSYIQKCNELCVDSKGVQLFEFENTSAKQSVHFILYSVPSGSDKFITGKERGTITDSFGTHEVLMHTDNFYEMLERMMDKWNLQNQDSTSEDLTMNLKTLTLMSR